MTTEATVPPAERVRPRVPVRRIVIGLVVLAIVAAAGVFGYRYFRDAALYVSTDDALIDSNLVPVAPTASGTLSIWRVKPGDVVRAGQVLGSIKPTAGSAFVNITSPIDGTILRVDGKEGQVVSQAQSLAFVADLSHMHVTAYIDEGTIGKVRVGQQVTVTADATGSTEYQGTVSEILPATASSFALIPSTDRSTANFTKTTQRIEIHIDIGSTQNTQLYPGENAYIRIRTA